MLVERRGRVPEYLRDAINLLDQFRRTKTAPSKASKIEAIEERGVKGGNASKLNWFSAPKNWQSQPSQLHFHYNFNYSH
jgi:hypothetical protein